MRPQPRVVLLLDPRPGSDSPRDLHLPDGRSLLDVVRERAIAEAGEVTGEIDGSAALADLLEDVSPHRVSSSDLCLVDAAVLALSTTYGDIVADQRPGPGVLRSTDSDRALGVRFDLASIEDHGELALLARAVRSAPPGGALTALAGALSAIGRTPREVDAAPFPTTLVAGPGDLEQAARAEAELDEAALRLRRSSRADDGFLSTFVIRPISRRLTRRAVAWGITPMAVTAGSFALGLLAAAAYSGGSLAWRLGGSLLLLVSLIVDCVDGEVARYTRTGSPRGGWLDVASDRTKEYAVYAGLAAGLVGAHAGQQAWRLAAAIFVVLLVRHVVDFGFAIGAISGAGALGGGGAEGAVAAWSERTNQMSALMWAKRALAMPVGERTLLLVVLAPALGARWCLIVVLVLSLVSAAYVTAGRLGRALGRSATRAANRAANRVGDLTVARWRTLVDLGPLAALAPVRSVRWGWLAPALARILEQGGLLLLVATHRPGALPAAYALLVVIALHQYDVVYRQRLADAVSDDSLPGRPGFVLRGAVILVLVLVTRGDVLATVLWALAGVLAVLAAVDSVRYWRDSRLGPVPRGRWLPTRGGIT